MPVSLDKAHVFHVPPRLITTDARGETGSLYALAYLKKLRHVSVLLRGPSAKESKLKHVTVSIEREKRTGNLPRQN